MEQVTILSQMFDFSIVTKENGEILEYFASNDTYKSNLSLHKSIVSFEEEIFSNPIFTSLVVSDEKQTFLQQTWNKHRVLTYVIHSNGNYIFGYNIIEKPAEVKKEPLSFNSDFIVKSPAMTKVAAQIQKAANAGATTLLLGESGVGKEKAARAIYQSGSRKNQPFVAINCGALPETLIESELFGYTEGSFTGAQKSGKIGKFREANKGVIFLDEVGELSLSMQVKLLRVLQERIVTPIGSSKEYPIDVQVIAATNKSLINMVNEGSFREDLYYRLNIIPITIPPLRERAVEIPELIEHFTTISNNKYHCNRLFSNTAIDFLTLQEWPGNVRELENFIERTIILADEDIISIQTARDFLDAPSSNQAVEKDFSINKLIPLQEAQELIEEQLITMAMEKYNSLKLAANVLGISPPTMTRKYKKIKEMKEEAQMLFSTRHILESELDKRLRATAVVTSVSISPTVLEEAVKQPNNTKYLDPLSEQLTQIYTREEGVQWGFIFVRDHEGNIVNLTSSEGFVIPVGTTYIGSDIILKSIDNAFKGIVSVTPVYEDEYGEWKTCCSPLYDSEGKVIAILGFDYSKEYVNNELHKLSESLNISLS
ncbi:transcriptional regulator with PAS, ATPase and Fis domain [Lysinibacillus composti]|uniref:AAA family ATPase n=1 Tax=Lysinibacillus composti TaxID=720633 RepID=A0A3N9U9E1_9BACI|nr:sigma 54-interacting transcriptional regulator [Lysinibacillus composti]MBM7610151.1 transcriptional regulator with PAS, ATPase and Fis domain [Lysinibacillus composti]RQW73204.1 AAA family ATPase [Lysinibacillus composti]